MELLRGVFTVNNFVFAKSFGVAVRPVHAAGASDLVLWEPSAWVRSYWIGSSRNATAAHSRFTREEPSHSLLHTAASSSQRTACRVVQNHTAKKSPAPWQGLELRGIQT